MTRERARILFISDTHLGLDLPRRPRVARRRRGPEFFAGLEQALAPALRCEVDLVVHGGDLFFRSRVSPALVERAFAPLEAVAERGVPVCIVPGNHERSRIPGPPLVHHPGIHVFDRPRTFVFEVRGLRVALSGFPFVRHGLRGGFRALVEGTRGRGAPADVRLLCLHQCVEGATVGPQGYVFRAGDDVIPGPELPGDFVAVLAGHIHRHQVLTRDLRGRELRAPVLYAGSTERTSFAERDETKGYLLVDVEADGSGRGLLGAVEFRELPTRPMVQLDLGIDRVDGSFLARTLPDLLHAQPPDAIVRLKIHGRPRGDGPAGLRAAAVRSVIPPTMNVSVRWTGDPAWRLDT
jgi:DNA repair exonuclease SbcCD nuclease subunit